MKHAKHQVNEFKFARKWKAKETSDTVKELKKKVSTART